MGFDLVIIWADSYSAVSLSYLCDNYYHQGKMEWYSLLCAARWFKLFKASKYRSILMWRNTVHMFRKANYYSRREE